MSGVPRGEGRVTRFPLRLAAPVLAIATFEPHLCERVSAREA